MPQRTRERERAGYAGRRFRLRTRKARGPLSRLPAITGFLTGYGVLMRKRDRDARQTWAEYVAAVRRATGMSRTEMARRLGVAHSTVWRWETGQQRPETPDAPEALARLLGLDVDEALAAAGLRQSGHGEPSPPPEPYDPEIELVRTDDRLSPETKERIIALIRRRREQSLEETRRMIEILRD